MSGVSPFVARQTWQESFGEAAQDWGTPETLVMVATVTAAALAGTWVANTLTTGREGRGL